MLIGSANPFKSCINVDYPNLLFLSTFWSSLKLFSRLEGTTSSALYPNSYTYSFSLQIQLSQKYLNIKEFVRHQSRTKPGGKTCLQCELQLNTFVVEREWISHESKKTSVVPGEDKKNNSLMSISKYWGSIIKITLDLQEAFLQATQE